MYNLFFIYHMMFFVVVDGVQVEPMVRRETRPEHKVIQPPPQGLFTCYCNVFHSGMSFVPE